MKRNNSKGTTAKRGRGGGGRGGGGRAGRGGGGGGGGGAVSTDSETAEPAAQQRQPLNSAQRQRPLRRRRDTAARRALEDKRFSDFRDGVFQQELGAIEDEIKQLVDGTHAGHAAHILECEKGRKRSIVVTDFYYTRMKEEIEKDYEREFLDIKKQSEKKLDQIKRKFKTDLESSRDGLIHQHSMTDSAIKADLLDQAGKK